MLLPQRRLIKLPSCPSDLICGKRRTLAHPHTPGRSGLPASNWLHRLERTQLFQSGLVALQRVLRAGFPQVFRKRHEKALVGIE